MKVALLITTYNRPQYLKDCIWSLGMADLSKLNEILIIDDNSHDLETLNILNNSGYNIRYNEINKGIKQNLLYGYERLFKNNDIVINLDSDAIVRPDFVERLIEKYYTAQILTGFHCIIKNANGSDRHRIIMTTPDFYLKESVGGINFCIDKYAYNEYVKPALLSTGNWDHNSCLNVWKTRKSEGIFCLKESVVQHIGFESSMNHTEQPDVADDFYYWYLPDVTLIGVDSNYDRLKIAADKCTKWIRFGDKKLITLDIRSKEQYSQFCIKELYKHVKTSHMLICQHDGYVHNWKAWDNDWLQYDYIGAPWAYNDGMSVGNGGFSLRSRRLMEIVATDPYIHFTHPEDHHICRTYRTYLETKYGIKFAPVEVAEKFSFEGYRQPEKFLKDQFGVHGPNQRTEPIRGNARGEFVVNQYQGVGDILFLVPMIRALVQEGNKVKWPIISHYMNIAKHFPDLDMVCKDEIDVPYNYPHRIQTQYGQLLPYRFAIENMNRPLTQCMQSKYELYGHDWHMWRSLYYTRFYDKEKELVELVGAFGDYILVNRYFGEPERCGKIEPIINSDLRIIEMSTVDGYSLIDWMMVIENAKEIHTANTSIMYLLELKQLNMPIYVYKRKTWGEKDFEYTRELWTNKAFIFEK